MAIIQNKKSYYVLVLILFTATLLFGRVNNCEAAGRYRSDEQMMKQYGTYYYISSLTGIKVSGGKVKIKGTLRTQYSSLLKHKTRTYRLAKTMRMFYIEGDEPWYYAGKKPRKEFIKNLKAYKKNHFPGIHFWVKNGKITAFGLSS